MCRTTIFIAPFTVLIPPNNRYSLSQMLVPIDDVNTMFYWIAWHESGRHRPGGVGAPSAIATPGSTWTRDYRKRRTWTTASSRTARR